MKNILFLLAILIITSTTLLAQQPVVNRLKKTAPIATNNSINAVDQLQFFLKVDQIKGNSKDANHKDWIHIEALHFETSQTLKDGRVSGNPKVKMTLSKYIDVASVEIAASVSNNVVHPKIELEAIQTIGRKKVVVLKYEVNNVSFSSFSQKSDESNKSLLEQIQLNFENVDITFYEYDNNGNLLNSQKRRIGFSMN